MLKKSTNNTLPPLADPAALHVLSLLEGAGSEAWMVGGCVRDALLGHTSSDIDIACSAPWQQTRRVMADAGYDTFETGTAHGTLTVSVDGETFEVTTYRIDGTYSDGRHPDHVTFARSIEEDLARRDFTINAMAYHPDRGLLDPFGGEQDIMDGTLRAVGDADRRFDEDALRILRGVRFASQLGFVIEGSTAAGMRRQIDNLRHVAVERIAHELEKMLCGPYVHDALMAYADIVFYLLPELRPMWKFEQHTKYHIYDVWEHSAYVVQYVAPTPRSRWAALLHDCGKPDSFFMDDDGVGHFYGHAKMSKPIAERLLHRLKMPPTFIHEVALLVQEHDTVIPVQAKSVKRMLRKLDGREDLMRDLCDLKRADSLAHAPLHQTGVAIAGDLERCLDTILAQDQAFSLRQLAIDGHDLMDLGIPEGPRIGHVLHALLDAVIDEDVLNDHDTLIAYARDIQNEHFR